MHCVMRWYNITEISKHEDNCLPNINAQVKGRHRWTIDNFLRRASCTEVGDSLCSPVFSVPVEAFAGEVQDLAFQLEVFPNGEEGEDNR